MYHLEDDNSKHDWNLTVISELYVDVFKSEPTADFLKTWNAADADQKEEIYNNLLNNFRS